MRAPQHASLGWRCVSNKAFPERCVYTSRGPAETRTHSVCVPAALLPLNVSLIDRPRTAFSSVSVSHLTAASGSTVEPSLTPWASHLTLVGRVLGLGGGALPAIFGPAFSSKHLRDIATSAYRRRRLIA
ncbi:hypothetical protein MTO96_016526 [Rhipicephalus appendiculatus]